MQARMYLPAYGKFAQPDPAYDQTKDDPESWNLYSYCMNNPVTHTDPDGRKSAGETPPPAPTPGQQQEDWNRIHGFSASNSTANAATQASPGATKGSGSTPSGAAANESRPGVGEGTQSGLTQDTLQKIGFTADQAKALASANVTVADLVAAVLTHEHSCVQIFL